MEINTQLDSECLMKLRIIFTKVLGNSYPRDDTFVEKLVALCQSFIRNSETCVEFVKETSALELIEAACTSEITPQAYAFFLRLFTRVTAGGFMNDAFHTHSKLFTRIHSFQDDASVRFAWTESAMTLCEHESFRKVLFTQPGFNHYLHSLCQDSSIFVAEKAHEFIGHLILVIRESDAQKSNDLQRQFITESLKDLEHVHSAILIMKAMLSQNPAAAFPIIRDHVTSMISSKFVQSFHLRKTWMEIFDVLLHNSLLTKDQLDALCSLPAELLSLSTAPHIAIDLAGWITRRVEAVNADIEKILTDPIHEYCKAPASYESHRLLLKSLHLITHLKSKDTASDLLLQVLRCVDVSSQNSAKLLVACLESCRTVLPYASRSNTRLLLDLTVALIQDTESPYLVIQQALQTAHCALSALCGDASTVPPATLHALAGTVSRRLCDVRWEVRDSAAEFLGKLAQGAVKDSPSLLAWLCESELLQGVLHSCGDGQSYVRATAMYSLAHVAAVPDAWNSLEASQTLRLIERVKTTALTDTEAFPRRAAVHFLTVLRQHNLHPADDIFKVMRTLAQDFDWEVKLKVLEFWKVEINTVLQKQEKQQEHCNGTKNEDNQRLNLSDLSTNGCCDFIRATLFDEDRSVQLAVCTLAKELKQNFHLDMNHDSEQPPAEKKQKLDVHESNTESSKPVNLIESDPVYSEDFVTWLSGQDLEKLERNASQSIDQYSDNPSSFLDDVLGSLCGKVEVCNDKDVDEASAVDCY